MHATKPDRWATPATFALLAVTALVFWQCLSFDLLNWDEESYLEPPQVRAGLTADSVRWAFATMHFDLWQPTTWLTFMTDFSWHGGSATGLHRTNLLLHLGAVAALSVALGRMTGDRWTGVAAAALFGLHPLQAEVVAWVGER